ncbi:MAG: nucleotidyl transferase AbiEii/AbiGii toxin family protein [Bacteroidales bacterium]|nr:nucleotidyl transferase AbiEii/AbiGii toxin family protein [Candidatus Sodaliphilus aphodohippi]
MTAWTKLSTDERLTILTNIAEEKGIVENAVEKDYWVSMVLRCIFSLPYADALVFKGGTSLSKAWNLIERFSEDIDLAIDRKFLGFGEELNKSQRTKLRKESKKFICSTLASDIEKKMSEYGVLEECKVVVPETIVSDLDPVVLFLEYNTILSQKIDYIPERVKIEISCRSLIEPFMKVAMRSMIEDAYPKDAFTMTKVHVPTVLPSRTFLEKIFLLHEEFTRPGGCTHIERLSRHMYDIEKMMDEPFAIEAMNNHAMYNEIIAHRRAFTAWSGLDYDRHRPQTISFVPPVEIKDALHSDYEQMKYGFIYRNAPSFEQIIERLTELQERFRNL